MKQYFSSSLGLLGLSVLAALGLTVCLTSPARADCASPYNGSDEAFIARADPALVAAHQALYAARVYNLMPEGQILVGADGLPLPRYWGSLRNEEAKSHFYATLLINHGVVGSSPPVRQDAAGKWEYDRTTPLLRGPNFHRSWDGYAPLTLDVSVLACQSVDPLTGGRACTPLFPWPLFTNIYGVGLGSGVVDGFPEDTGSSARFRPIWDLFKDPDWQIQYTCKAVADSAGIVTLARTIVHENWHSTAAPTHLDGTSTPGYSGDPSNACTGSGDRCDTFIWNPTTSAQLYAGLASQQYEGVGSYQVDQEFMCDLVESGADWLPLELQLVAQQHFEFRASQSRFVNPELGDRDGDPATSDSGQLPYTCGVPSSILSVPADGINTCPGTDQLRCQTDADCDDNNVWTTDQCASLCCDHFVLK